MKLIFALDLHLVVRCLKGKFLLDFIILVYRLFLKGRQDGHCLKIRSLR